MHCKPAKVVRYAICLSFGAYMSIIGYSIDTWQFWPAVMLLAAHGIASAEEVRA